MSIVCELTVRGVRVRLKSDSWVMALIGKILGKWFMQRAWTTIGPNTIWAPSSADLDNLLKHEIVLRHELVHIKQARCWPCWFQLSYLLLPMPFLFAWGRWRWEREAYLVNIEAGTHPIEDVVQLLWSKYAWCWPKPLMRRWFLKQRGVPSGS